MPELPEVETIARTLRPELIGRQIVSADVRWPRTLAAPSIRRFKRQIQGQIIQDIARRAKFLHIRLSASHLLIHLRMSGDLEVKQGKARPEKHDRLIVVLSHPESDASPPISAAGNGTVTSLVFSDARKFGRVWLIERIEPITSRLGPEPLSRGFTPRVLYDRLRARRRRLKPLLLDQTFLAGLGNIYTDEALHLAKLHPLRSSETVTARQAELLHGAIRAVLREGIRRNGASIDWVYRGGEFQNHFRVYDRDGEPCPVCGTAIRRLVVGQRGTHVCPHCQRM
ncbi:MAG: bifunctional DNA-formamidopyrimidine glycosylase/DNA-(apurinic or apyrimidinic site) lyase [Chloroflexota bacterium]